MGNSADSWTTVSLDNVYMATWASLLAVYRHKAANPDSITTVAFPAMGAGFGGVPYTEVARQMAVAYRHYLSPPHRMNWEMIIDRERAIQYDGDRQVCR